MTRSWIAVLSGTVLAGALLTGCVDVSPGSAPGAEPATTGTGPGAGEPTTTDPGTGTGGTGSGATTASGQATGTELATETGGAESTGARETGQSVRSPRLPVGGDTEFTADRSEQCAHVSFLGEDENSIPPAVSIVVTGAEFSAGLFEVGGSACHDLAPGEPGCLEGYVFTANDTGSCVVPVHTDVTRPAGTTDQVPDQLRLTGRLQCPTGQAAACRDLAARLDLDAQAIDVFPPVETTEEPTGTTEEPTGTTGGPTGTTEESTETTGESTETTEESTETVSSQPASSGAED